MKVRHNKGGGDDKIELQMTPMIDIVFQLLVFFIMTFKIVSQEGDFNIKMPLAAPAAGAPDDLQLPPMKVRLRAGGGGVLAGMSLNDKGVGTMEALRLEIIGVVGDDRGPGSIQETAEVELDCDYGLRYEHVIQAITAVSGYIDDTGNVVKLVEKIKFAPPRQASGE
ncbi:MAG: biopolymer transporter ExbD [Planctomycetaceae bacterium]|nr:biopolymer transporter ExbD [Planctomycetales bacterium]MCB9938300.1 biopolymer transporter ExbD [Planctomycetaceae bacterium]